MDKPEGAIDLSEGAWALIADPKRVSERKRRSVIESISHLSSETVKVAEEAARTGDELDTEKLPISDVPNMMSVVDHCIVAMLISWSFDTEITIDNVLDLAGEDYRILTAATEPFMDNLAVNFEPNPSDRSSPSRP